METIENVFRKLLKVDVSKHVEKKGQFAYLSWPYAVSQLRLSDPSATWQVQRFNGLPYLQSDLGCFVEVSVTVQGITLSQIHPVLDARNRPIPTPSAFDINTSIQRCLVKAIALHGLGLNVYAGEDLPIEAEDTPANATVTPIQREHVISKAELDTVQKLLAETGVNEAKLLDHFGFFTLDSIPYSEVKRVIKALEAKRKAA